MTARLALPASPERSFESFYRTHAPDTYRYALAMLGSPDDAEEVTQTTFLNAYRAIERGDRPRNARAWLHGIALNLCRQRFRHAARRPSEVPLGEQDIAEIVPDGDAPTLADLTRALEHIPFNQRAALVMRELDGRSPPEIAAALDLSLAAVQTLLFRARRALREQLEGALTCHEAERAIAAQLDGLLARAERGPLRAHLRACADCATLARSMRAQSGAMKALAALPVPGSLAWMSGLGSAAAGAGAAGGASLLGSLAAKLAVGAVAATVLAGTTYEGITHGPWRATTPATKPVAGAQRAASAGPSVAGAQRAVSAGPSAAGARLASFAGTGATGTATGSASAAASSRGKDRVSSGLPGSDAAHRGPSAGRLGSPDRSVRAPAQLAPSRPRPARPSSPARRRPVTAPPSKPASARRPGTPPVRRPGAGSRPQARAPQAPASRPAPASPNPAAGATPAAPPAPVRPAPETPAPGDAQASPPPAPARVPATPPRPAGG